MNFLQCLTEALLDPAQAQQFLRKADTLLRRSLRLPHLRFERHTFPPDAIAICVVAHLSQFSLQRVYDACTSDMCGETTKLETTKPESPVQDFDDLKRVWEHGWQPAASLLRLPDGHCEGNGRNRLFVEYYVFLVPSLFFSKRLAAFLLTKVQEHGGKGKLVASGEKGFMQVAEEMKTGPCARHAVLCTDVTLLKRLAHLRHIPSLPHKWLSDSIRDCRVKSMDIYSLDTPKPLASSPVTPATPVGKRVYADVDNNIGDFMETSTRKRVRGDGPVTEDSRNEASVQLKKQLFRTPIKDRDSFHMNAVDKKPASSRKMKWACEVRTSFNGSEFPMNDKICELLGVVKEAYATKKDHFRALGYQKAIAKIRSLPYELLTGDDAKRAGGEATIGVSIQRKIVEILKTGRLLQAEAVLENLDNNTVKAFCDIWGVGPVKAMHLVAQGIKSIEQLREEAKKDPRLLDKNQKIGLRLYEDLLHRIPRNEVADLEMYVRKVVKSIDSTLDITVAGSYLRGKSTCGDVDVMIHGPTENVRNAFPKVHAAMKKSGILTDDLVDGPDKYFGVFKFPGRRHGRVDLFAVPKEQYPYALLTYTGSAIFNRSMRAKARALGYSLSHKGLQRVCRTKHSKARLEPSILVKDEKEIFFLLDIPYVPPSARSIS